MNVQEWLAEPVKHHTAAALSRATGISPPALSKKLHGKGSMFSLGDAVLLEQATNGVIRAEEVCPEYAKAIAYIRGVKA